MLSGLLKKGSPTLKLVLAYLFNPKESISLNNLSSPRSIKEGTASENSVPSFS